MSSIMPFDYQGYEIRTVLIDGNPWFVGKDVCLTFGDSNYRRSLARLDDDEKGVSQIDTPGGSQSMTTVNETGLYSLLFFMQPQKGNLPEEQFQARSAQIKSFRRWITHDVIPQIRKSGSYSIVPKTLPEALRAYADEVEKRELAEKQVALMSPKADFFDSVADSKDAIPIGEAAKVLNMGIGQNNLFKLLREKSILRHNNQPYQEYIDRGYFRVIEQKYDVRGETRINIKTLVYQKGLEYIRQTIKKQRAVGD